MGLFLLRKTVGVVHDQVILLWMHEYLVTYREMSSLKNKKSKKKLRGKRQT